MEGFYKLDNDKWFFAPNFVYAKDYTLEKDGNRESVDGWQWFDQAPQEYIIWELLKNKEDEAN
jgi:hypothetical protein